MEHPAADDSDHSSEDESFDPFNWIEGVEMPSNPPTPLHYFQVLETDADGRILRWQWAISPPCQCSQCIQQFRPLKPQKSLGFNYQSSISYDEAQAMAREYVKSAQADRQYIEEKLKIHGNTIEKRWKKWSHAKREVTLRQVDKDLYEKRWPEVQILCDFTAKPKATLEDHIRLQAQLGQCPIRNALLLPYRNLELLKSNPKPLLALLNSRTKYSSQEWASFDNHIISKPWELGILQLIHNPNAIIMHGASYGQLVLWDSQLAHDWRAVGFPKSILVLEAQHELLKFLKKAVDVMLVGVVADTNTVSRPPFRFTSTDLKRGNIAASSEFASTYLFQPFSAPPKFDVDTMISLATTRHEFYVDHLMLLQTEPSMARRHFNLHLAGSGSSNIEKKDQRIKATTDIVEDVLTCISWEMIINLVKNIELLHRASTKVDTRGKNFPRHTTRHSRLSKHI